MIMDFKRQKKMIALVLVVILALPLMAGCAAEKTKTKTITDTTGVQVEMPAEIARVAVVPIPWASIVFTLDGEGSKLVGMHPSAKKAYEKSIFKKLAPELSEAKTNYVDNDFTIHMEEALALKPDIMVVWDYQTKEIEQLKEIGIPAVALKYGTMEDLQGGIKVLGEVLNKQEKADKLINYHKDALSYFESKKANLANVEKSRVLYLRDEDLKVAAGGTVNSKFIELAGGENVAKDVKGQWVNATMEQVVTWNPDIIIMSNFSDFKPEALYQNTIKGQDWSMIDAVKNKRVLKAPMGIYRWDAPCGESPLMIKWMSTVIQPEVFHDIDMKAEIERFYKEFYDYDITLEEIDSILQKTVNP